MSQKTKTLTLENQVYVSVHCNHQIVYVLEYQQIHKLQYKNNIIYLYITRGYIFNKNVNNCVPFFLCQFFDIFYTGIQIASKILFYRVCVVVHHTTQQPTVPLSCVTGCVPSRMASRACTYNKFNCTGSLESIF